MVFKGKNKDFKEFLDRLKKGYGSNATLKEVEEKERAKKC